MGQISDAWFYRIKAAQRDLIRLSGGIERASEITSFSKSSVGRWNNATDPELMPLPAVLLLENECGTPIVTSVMAELNNRRLADPDGVVGNVGSIFGKYADFLRVTGEVAQTGAAAFADGKLSPSEATVLDRRLSDVEQVISDIRQVLAAVRAGDGLRVVG